MLCIIVAQFCSFQLNAEQRSSGAAEINQSRHKPSCGKSLSASAQLLYCVQLLLLSVSAPPQFQEEGILDCIYVLLCCFYLKLLPVHPRLVYMGNELLINPN